MPTATMSFTGRDALITAISIGRALFKMRNASPDERNPSDEADLIKLVLDRGLVAEVRAELNALGRDRPLKDEKAHFDSVAAILRDRYDVDVNGEVLDLLDCWFDDGEDVDFIG